MTLKTAVDELSRMAEQLTQLAAARDLTVVPVTPSCQGGPRVLLDAEDMTAEAFVDLAVTAGQRLLYLQADRFDHDDLFELRTEAAVDAPDPDEADAGGADAALRRTSERFLNWPISLEVAFIAGGVTHFWSDDADWHQELIQAWDDLQPAEPGTEDTELSEAEEEAQIEQLAADLLALPDFRAVNTDTARRRVAKTHLATRTGGGVPADQMDHIRWRAISRATENAIVEEQRHYAGAENRLAELAQQIAADPAYRSTRTASARKHRVRDHLMAQADGFAPPGRLVDLLIDALTAPPRSVGGPALFPLD